MCDRAFNVKVLVLSCAAFRGKNCTAVDLLEIPVRKFVSFLGVFVFLVVDSQMLLRIFAESVLFNEIVFFFGGWLMLAPSVPVVHHDFSSADEFLGMVERLPVQFDCHTYLLSSW